MMPAGLDHTDCCTWLAQRYEGICSRLSVILLPGACFSSASSRSLASLLMACMSGVGLLASQPPGVGECPGTPSLERPE